MIKRLRARKLSVLLILYALSSLLLAAGVYLGGSVLGGWIVRDAIYTKDRIIAHEKQVYHELCAYIRQENIQDVDDNEKLAAWFAGKRDLIVFIYDYYRQGADSLSTLGSQPAGSDEDTVMYSSLTDAASTYGLLQSRYADYWYHGPMEIRGVNDFPKVMRVMYFPMYTAQRYITAISALLAFASFALCLTLLVKRKTNYISELSGEVNAMAAGELTRPLTVRGRDELASLAENMESLRRSFIERLNREETMNKNASQLLTDMSHDLRTPLTALMGYLDILDDGKAATPELAKKYIASAKNRAYQIKGMTDELFEYFLVYSYEEDKIDMETVDALTLFSQIWEETSFSLESAGFEVENDVQEVSANVEANPQLVKRVFDNIASNILKYADKTCPVRARMFLKDGMYCFLAANAVSGVPSKAESSHIGLSSCEKIARLHGGRFEHNKVEGDGAGERLFSCSFCLPVLTKK